MLLFLPVYKGKLNVVQLICSVFQLLSGDSEFELSSITQPRPALSDKYTGGKKRVS